MIKILTVIVCSLAITGLFAQANQKAKTGEIVAKNKPTATTPKGSNILRGMFGAPSGTAIVLQYNGKNDLAVSATKEKGMMAGNSSFSFVNPITDGMKFKVTLKKGAAGQTISIYSGSEGSMPVPVENLRVGADYTYDLVSRSSNDAVFSTFYETEAADLGGADEGRFVVFVSSAPGFAGPHLLSQ